MDPWSAALVVARRWRVALPVFLIAVLAAVAVAVARPAQYRADASIVLVGPHGRFVDGVRVAPTSPYDPRSAAGVVARQLSSRSTHDRLGGEGFSSTFSADADVEAAIVDLRATAADRSAAVDTTQRLLEEAQASLLRVQQDIGVEDDATIRIETVNAPLTATRVPLRPTVPIGIVIVGAVAAAIAARQVDRRAGRPATVPYRMVRQGESTPPDRPAAAPVAPGNLFERGARPAPHPEIDLREPSPTTTSAERTGTASHGTSTGTRPDAPTGAIVEAAAGGIDGGIDDGPIEARPPDLGTGSSRSSARDRHADQETLESASASRPSRRIPRSGGPPESSLFAIGEAEEPEADTDTDTDTDT